MPGGRRMPHALDRTPRLSSRSHSRRSVWQPAVAVVWVLLMVALWLWGHGPSGSGSAGQGPVLGDVSRAGSLARERLTPQAGPPAPDAKPTGRSAHPAAGPADGEPVRVAGVRVRLRTVQARDGSVLVATARTRPAVRALSALEEGARVTVRRTDGTAARYRVLGTRRNGSGATATARVTMAP
ncbi:hypothetical protein [Streptomyces spirodelae]|uniref:DUF5666 domain-containing protein n=1 Tax=Streptomyces spirodelae TaxID=2812904 RepID=A0ABS3WNZ9_9ACTN|nr:hypothetical protein [Streptomyces spirodelae]MBO8184843.1 hypothetical protein [Streptomyces spirodelae]